MTSHTAAWSGCWGCEKRTTMFMKYKGDEELKMRKTKALMVLLTVFTLAFGLTACGGSSKNANPVGTQAAAGDTASAGTADIAETGTTAKSEATEKADSTVEPATTETTTAEAASAAEPETPAHSSVLVAYFSATGTTEGVAEKIAAVTGGDLYEILAAETYTEEDLNYNNRSSRSTTEQNDKNARPEIGSEDISLEGYTTIYLGFPIWWGEEPRILDTFVEKYSFDGITVIPFCTSGGSGIGRSGPNMEALAGSGTWLDGKRFSANVSEEDLQAWIESLQ